VLLDTYRYWTHTSEEYLFVERPVSGHSVLYLEMNNPKRLNRGRRDQTFYTIIVRVAISLIQISLSTNPGLSQPDDKIEWSATIQVKDKTAVLGIDLEVSVLLYT
jgi:hypothetical protein